MKQLAINDTFWAGYLRSCKSAEFIRKKKQVISTYSYSRISYNSVIYFQFQFPLLVCFYSVVEVK